MKMNKALIGVAAAVVAAVAIIAVLVATNDNEPQQATPTPTPAVTAVPTPTAQATDAPSEEKQTPKEEEASDKKQDSQPDTEQKVYTPTFMYFVSDSDEGFDATMVMVDELKKEYKDKVTFDVRNIDENPELAENFPVAGNTPTLIMLNTKNDISNILFKTSEKDKLKAAIDAALK